MRLGREMGHVNIDEMLHGLTGLQMQEWERFYQCEPFGAEVQELRLGNICAVLANLQRDSKTPPFTPNDFLVTCFKAKQEPQSFESLMAAIEGAFSGS